MLTIKELGKLRVQQIHNLLERILQPLNGYHSFLLFPLKVFQQLFFLCITKEPSSFHDPNPFIAFYFVIEACFEP
jgi:hypothetical protein